MESVMEFPRYPLFCVPYEAKVEIAQVFDIPSVTNVNMENLAQRMDSLCGYRLRFDNISLSYLRHNHNCTSPTLAMLREAEKKNVDTQILQQAIEELGASADRVLPSYLPAIKGIYEARFDNMRQTGNPGNSTCTCLQCTQMNGPRGYYQPNHFPGSPQPYHSPMDSNHNNTLVPPESLPSNNAILNGRCAHPHCAHNRIGQESYMRNIPVNVDRQYSEDDNNRQFLRHPQGRNTGTSILSDPLPISPTSESYVDGVRPRSFPQRTRRESGGGHRDRNDDRRSCNCKQCEEIRLTDSDETELKTSTSTYPDLSQSFQQSCFLQTPPHMETCPDPSNNNSNLTRERSNSDVSSRQRDDQSAPTRNSNSDSDIPHMPLQCTCSKITKIPSVKGRTIFVTLADHSNTHIQEVLKLCNYLYKVGFDIRCDMMDKLFENKNLNKNEWIDLWFKKAEYVLFCISPRYHEFINVGTKKEMEEKAQAEPNHNRFHTRYIFDRARSEYIDNASLNYRFIPVIFRNSGATRKHVPDFLHATLCYVYPNAVHERSLERFLLSNSQKTLHRFY